MQISRLKYSQFNESYGIFCSFLPRLSDRDGLYPTFCRILRGGNTIAHTHFEPELFYIVSGCGLMTIDDETEKVYAGDLIRIPSLSSHKLKNIGIEDLIFLSVYSEDTETPLLPTSVIITSAPPTPNGPLHLGHISGPYLASDILARYLRLRSLNVYSHSGTDDHQNYIHEKANSLRIAPENFRKQMRSRIQNGFATMRITFNEFIEPKTDSDYQNKILDFAQRAIELKVIEKEFVELPYCTYCDETLIDSRINGSCPFCKEASHGICENCGIVVPPYDLKNATCSRCNSPADKKTFSVYTFELNKYLPAIQKELSQLSLCPRLQDLIKHARSMNHLKILLTYPDISGQGLTLPGSNQILHAWFEMAAHYEQFALNQTFWVHCFGFDNSFYYLLFIPALLRAISPQAKLPNAVITNDFLQLEGLKFSTSRKHAVWADEFSGNIDHLRMYLSFYRPSIFASDFSNEKFQHFSLDLEKQLQHLNQRAQIVAKQKLERVSPQKIIDCNRITRDMEFFLSPTHFDLRRASRQLFSLIDLTLQAKRTGSSERLMLHTLATLMSPFMPKESKNLFDSLEENSPIWVKDWSKIYAII
ncbi:MAG: class I tRNA ligase family protein [Gammaproteobacteria bacterium]|nr:class I tRNA ligase family protein [Gammaproteobacteria bacterium]MCW5582373.1 class I tRNA ligase family protein [Gammaproteobacteria bacterium]